MADKNLKRELLLALRRLIKGDRFTANGVDIVLPKSVNTELRYLIAKGRPYEAEEARFVRDALPEGTNVIELGGSLGIVSAVIRDVIGPEAQHIIVEANPDVAPVCLANGARHAEAGACSLVEAAVAYTDAPTIGFTFGHNPHVGGIDAAGGAVQVPVVTLSSLAAQITGRFALVADIEGAEWDMIFEETEVFSRVSHLIIEIHPEVFAANGQNEAALITRLESLGFAVLEREEDVLLLRGPAG